MLPNHPCAGFVAIPSILMPLRTKTQLGFGLTSLELEFDGQQLHIRKDAENFTAVSLKDQRVAYKVQLLGSIVLKEESTGKVEWSELFRIEWEDEAGAPEIVFERPPTRIVRQYDKGQAIELGVEPASQYEVRYDDDVQALFSRRKGPDGEPSPRGGFDFRFSTGFAGAFWKEPDGSWMINFKGDRLAWDDDGKDAQSKFLVSRSKFTDNLMLYFWHSATVTLR
jgi:hypothetical protein